MRCIWLKDGELSYHANTQTPVPEQGELLVRVLCSGICNTDLELVNGYYPYNGILGHEFVGRIESGPDDLLGKRVVGEINIVCGKCASCLSDRRNHCHQRTVLGIVNKHGAFADYLTLPRENLHLVPDSVSTEEATFTEPLAAALRIQQQVELDSGQRVLVIGDGKLGLLIAQTLQLSRNELLVVGRHEAKLEILSQRGIEVCLAKEFAQGDFDVVVECTGSVSGFNSARESLRPKGTLVMKSTYAGQLTVDASALVVDEITVIGSRCGPFPMALELLRNGTVDVTPLIHEVYGLEEGIHAFERARHSDVLKVLLNMDQDKVLV